jgi:IS1 family transposase
MDICKKKVIENEEEAKLGYGDKWIWTAIDASTRLMIGYHIGNRQLDDCRAFLSDLASRLSGKPLFVSDELEHYASILFEIYHNEYPVPKSGKPGHAVR